jgi:NAD(P)-dependent dehydrogenase (short-subunit alcohol dehydrogenase family)
MSKKLLGKVAVVTGSGSPIGIGRAVVIALAAEGASVVVNDIGKDKADNVVAEIVKAKGKAVANYDSVATVQGGAGIIKTALDSFGKIDILVNCAGNFFPKRFADTTEQEWDSIISVHVKGHFATCKAAVPEMIKQKSGRIINFSSRGATVGGGAPAYSTAKAAILGLTTSLAGDLKEYGITVNAMLPSAVTELFPYAKKRMEDNLPVAETTQPEYVAPMVCFLATEEAKNITARFFYASGGDIVIYPQPLLLPAESPMFIRKIGKWTLEELTQVIPSLMLA